MLTVIWKRNASDIIMALGVAIRKKTHTHTLPAGVYHTGARDKTIRGKIGKL